MSAGSMRTSRGDGSDHQRFQQLKDKVNTMGTQASANDDMPNEIDFSKGTRGKFFKTGAALNLPVYLDAEVQAYLADRAKARGVEVAQLVNELLRKDIELIEAAR
jgi:hypothetical protein